MNTNNLKNIDWFKREIVPKFYNYKITYRFFENGDFGSLNQAVLQYKRIEVVIDFWGLEWLGIFAYDFEKEADLLNLLLEPNEIEEKDKAFKELFSILGITSELNN
jgi:hypothetical protein